MKEPEIELQASQNVAPTDEDFYMTVYPVGPVPAITLSSRYIEQVRQSEEERARSKNNKPPRPPKRPNIPIGRTALQG